MEHVRYFYVLIERLFIMLRRKKGWRLNIFPQYHANLTQPISDRESQLFAMLVPVTNEVVCAWLKDFRIYAFPLALFKPVVVRYGLWVNALTAIFFSMEDWVRNDLL